MKSPVADQKCKILAKDFGLSLCTNVDYKVKIFEELSGDYKAVAIAEVMIETQ